MMPDRNLLSSQNSHTSTKSHHRISMPYFTKHDHKDRDGSKSPGANKRSFLGFNIGKHDSSESLTSPVLTNSYDQQHHYNQQIHVPLGNLSGHNISNDDHRSNHSSMVELKRFFRPMRKNSIPKDLKHKDKENNHHNHNYHHSDKHNHGQHHHHHEGSTNSPEAIGNTNSHVNNNNKNHSSSSLNPIPTNYTASQIQHNANGKDPFDVDSSLVKKYGRLGKILGSGAGGSVRLLTRESDGVTFAVKEFRQRRATEPLKEYAKKCTAEFCIGSTLHHPNIIKTLDILNEGDRYFEVMEYCPIDFFAVVMSDKMSRSEINCCLKQILSGVSYLHSMGLSHRDLKLDNCVITKNGILKLIDFGSAVVFRYPFEDKIAKARGIVGSDPYLAPEVLKLDEYDPRPVDIWSIGIIYCCMTLKRFPWKAPKPDDPSFKLYCLPDDTPHDYFKSNEQHKLLLNQRRLRSLLEKENKIIIEKEKEKEKEIKIEQDERLTVEVEKIAELISDSKSEDPATKEIEIRETTPIEHQNSRITDDRESKKSNDMDLDVEQVQENGLHREPEQKQQQIVDETSIQPSEGITENVTIAKIDTRTNILQQLSEIEVHLKQLELEKQEAKKKYEESKKALPKDEASHKQIHGPYRLMRLLPHASRHIISKILKINPNERATLEDINNDPWVKSISFCTTDDNDSLIPGTNHTHVVIDEEDAHIESYKHDEKKST